MVVPSQTVSTGKGHRRIGSDEYSRLTSATSPLAISPGLPTVHHSNTYPSDLLHLGQSQTGGQGQSGDVWVRGQGDGQATSPPARSVSYQPQGQSPVLVSPRSISLSSEHQLPALARQGHEAGTPVNVEDI